MSEAATTPATGTPADGTPAAAPAADGLTPPGSLLNTPADPAAAADGDKPADPAAADKPAAPVIPETYEFKAPEIDGKPVEIDTAALEGFQVKAKELGLTQEQFQALGQMGFDAQMKAATAAAQKAANAPVEAWHAMQRDWQQQVQNDPDIGGTKLGENLSFAVQAIDRFGGQALKDALEITGAGNNPAVVKAFIAMGRAIADPTSLSLGKPTGGARSKSGEQAARDVYNAAGGNYPDVA